MRFLINYVARCWLSRLGFCALGEGLKALEAFAEEHLSL